MVKRVLSIVFGGLSILLLVLTGRLSAKNDLLPAA